MAYYWIFITFFWFGSVSLQYINTAAGPGAESLLDPLDASIHYPPLPYHNYFNAQNLKNNFETFQNDRNDHEYFRQDEESDLQRKRRTVIEDSKEEGNQNRWLPTLIDNDKTIYLRNDEKANPFILQAFASASDENDGNSTERNLVQTIERKRSFSPWGGKRDKPLIEHTWTWKRSSGIREPSMPKRVRFSPWGGKRSGQMIFKPGNKGTKVIFSASVPELTRIISSYTPNGNRVDLTGFQFVPSLDKRHPIKILALSTNLDDRTLRDALPFNTFMEPQPRFYKPGHPYSDVNLKKDGKRKVKFSVWGGKRSPPIIGPIWTPASQDVKESTLNRIVLVRNQDNEGNAKTM